MAGFGNLASRHWENTLPTCRRVRIPAYILQLTAEGVKIDFGVNFHGNPEKNRSKIMIFCIPFTSLVLAEPVGSVEIWAS